MAKASTTPHAAIAAGFAINGFALFKGYSALEDGQETILEEGMPVRIDRFENEADIVVIGVDDEGNDIMSEDGTTPKYAERVFPEELTPAELDPDGDEAEATEETADEPAAEEAEEAAEPEPEPAKAKATPAKKATAAKADKPETAAAKKKREAAEAKAAAAAEKAATVAANKKKAADAKAKKAADAEKAKAKIAATPVVEVTDMASVKEILAEQDALVAAKSLVDRAEQTDFTLGGVLRHIHETGAFKSIGYDGKRGFDDYVKLTLGVEPRKARYLMTMYTAFAMIGADEEKLQQIGWSKAKELARIETSKLKKDFDSLVDKANELTRDDLTAYIKKNYKVTTRGGADGVNLTTFSFRLAEEEAATVNEGLNEAKAMVGEDDLNKAFAYIVGDWRGTGTGTDLSLEDTAELMAAKFGITKLTLTAADGTEQTFEFEDAPEGAAEETAEAEA